MRTKQRLRGGDCKGEKSNSDEWNDNDKYALEQGEDGSVRALLSEAMILVSSSSSSSGNDNTEELNLCHITEAYDILVKASSVVDGDDEWMTSYHCFVMRPFLESFHVERSDAPVRQSIQHYDDDDEKRKRRQCWMEEEVSLVCDVYRALLFSCRLLLDSGILHQHPAIASNDNNNDATRVNVVLQTARRSILCLEAIRISLSIYCTDPSIISYPKSQYTILDDCFECHDMTTPDGIVFGTRKPLISLNPSDYTMDHYYRQQHQPPQLEKNDDKTNVHKCSVGNSHGIDLVTQRHMSEQTNDNDDHHWTELSSTVNVNALEKEEQELLSIAGIPTFVRQKRTNGSKRKRRNVESSISIETAKTRSSNILHFHVDSSSLSRGKNDNSDTTNIARSNLTATTTTTMIKFQSEAATMSSSSSNASSLDTTNHKYPNCCLLQLHIAAGILSITPKKELVDNTTDTYHDCNVAQNDETQFYAITRETEYERLLHFLTSTTTTTMTTDFDCHVVPLFGVTNDDENLLLRFFTTESNKNVEKKTKCRQSSSYQHQRQWNQKRDVLQKIVYREFDTPEDWYDSARDVIRCFVAHCH